MPHYPLLVTTRVQTWPTSLTVSLRAIWSSWPACQTCPSRQPSWPGPSTTGGLRYINIKSNSNGYWGSLSFQIYIVPVSQSVCPSKLQCSAQQDIIQLWLSDQTLADTTTRSASHFKNTICPSSFFNRNKYRAMELGIWRLDSSHFIIFLLSFPDNDNWVSIKDTDLANFVLKTFPSLKWVKYQPDFALCCFVLRTDLPVLRRRVWFTITEL